jgi:cytochrome oxidase Cu insertion factor (SCO1/SenC/PrrC family)
MAANQQSRRHRWILGLFFIVIFGPVIFAWVLVQRNAQVSMKLNHHGDLIKPLQSIQSFTELNYAPYQGKWLLLMIAPNECNQQQSDHIHDIHQLKIALGKETERVQPIFVSLSPASESSCKPLLTPYADIAQWSLSEHRFESQLGSFSHALKRQAQGELYIVDPKGHIMMHYDASVPAGDVLKDLKRLLRVSKIG